MARRDQDFQTIRSEGGLLPSDLLRRVLDPRANLAGTKPEDYGLPPGERPNESITQSWNRLRKHWVEFRGAAAGLGEGEAGTGLTNDKWSLPLLREIGFGILPTTAGPVVGGRSYAISRFFGPVPVHLVGCGLSLDRRAVGQRGAAAVNPHGLVQEFLNRSPDHLWAIVGNGLRLRVLRDNQALSRQSFLEFDLEAMFQGELYSDFVLLWLMVHATRFAPREGDRPESCWLEQWSKEAEEQGTRALEGLRGGVEKALLILGQGLTSHPRNSTLRDLLRTGKLPLADFHGQLLRVVYRLIFLFVSEDRTLDGQPLLHPRDDSETARSARDRFTAHYGTGRLRELAGKIKGSRHGDLWQQFQIVAGSLSGGDSSAAIRQNLALPALGSFLWNPDSTGALNAAELTNHDFLEALRHLAFTRQGKVLRPVDYKNLGAEELGGVYESLLALTPQISADGALFTFAEFAGNERKTSGSYYTHDSLVQCLLDSALDPVVEEAIKGKSGTEAERALLALKVCDPAVGSGHFLVGAAHRLARHLSRVRAQAQGESEPSPLLYQHALRDVIGRCLYGVDVNPMAAELCRVSLWLEALEPGKPLSFLDHHVRVGNSLFGATPELIAAGLPDEAFTAIDGDDRKACAVLKKRNKAERKGSGPLFARQDAEVQARLQNAAAAVELLPDDRPEDIRAKELAFRRHEETEEYRQKRQLANAWCGAFVIKKHFREPGREASASGITQGHLNTLAAGQALPAELAAEAAHLTCQYQFFHWHLAFPEVFANGGFDCVLGNPPWDEIQFEETAWFASREPDIAAAATAAKRESLIAELELSSPNLFAIYRGALRDVESQKMFARSTGLYPAGAVGKLNTYVLFVERNAALVNPVRGTVGCVVPTGLATDKSTSGLFELLVSSGRARSLFDFVNVKLLFPGIRPHQHFCLLTLGSSRDELALVDVAAFLTDVADLRDPEHRYSLSWRDVVALNPEAKTLSLFATTAHADTTRKLVASFAPLGAQATDDTWGATYQQGTFNTASASDLFRTATQLKNEGFCLGRLEATTASDRYVPLFDAKMARQYEWRATSLSFSGHQFRKVAKATTPAELLEDSSYVPSFTYWVPAEEANRRLGSWRRPWLLGFKDVTGVTSTRLAAFALAPRMGFGDGFPLLKLPGPAEDHAFILAWMNSILVEFFLRQRMQGLHLTWHLLAQVPTPSQDLAREPCPWDSNVTVSSWLASRVAELSVTSWPLVSFAEDLGLPSIPFRYDAQRRSLLRAEIDAALFVLAEFSVEEAGFVLDYLDRVRNRDVQQFGDYRTKSLVLEMMAELARAASTGKYQTRLDPPPADPRCCHPPLAKSQEGSATHG